MSRDWPIASRIAQLNAKHCERVGGWNQVNEENMMECKPMASASTDEKKRDD